MGFNYLNNMKLEYKYRVYSFLSKDFIYFDIYEGVPSGVAGGISEPQQYTGIKDKNGKEIYVGDIIKFKVKYCTIEYRNQTSITDFSNKVYKDETIKEQVGVVVFDIINDIDDFYNSCVLGYGVNFKDDSIESLYQLLKDYSQENNIEYTYSKYYDNEYYIIGNIFENGELITK